MIHTFPWLEGQSPNHLKLKPERPGAKFQAAVTAGPSIFLVKHYNQQSSIDLTKELSILLQGLSKLGRG